MMSIFLHKLKNSEGSLNIVPEKSNISYQK
jgi:hypothetical protein